MITGLWHKLCRLARDEFPLCLWRTRRDSGYKGPSDKSLVSPAACQNQRVTSPLRRTVAPATTTKVHKRMKAERKKLLLLFSLFNCGTYTRQYFHLFPFVWCRIEEPDNGPRHWVGVQGLKWSACKAKVQCRSDTFISKKWVLMCDVGVCSCVTAA